MVGCSTEDVYYLKCADYALRAPLYCLYYTEMYHAAALMSRCCGSSAARQLPIIVVLTVCNDTRTQSRHLQ